MDSPAAREWMVRMRAFHVRTGRSSAGRRDERWIVLCAACCPRVGWAEHSRRARCRCVPWAERRACGRGYQATAMCVRGYRSPTSCLRGPSGDADRTGESGATACSNAERWRCVTSESDDLGASEVRKDAIDEEVCLCDGGEQRVELGAGSRALAVHAGVDLNMYLLLLQGSEGFDLPGCPDDGREAVLGDEAGLAGDRAAHDEDLRSATAFGAEPCLLERGANACAFGCVGDTEPTGAGAGQHRGALRGAVAVGVGLDDCEDLGLRICRVLNDAEVAGETFLGDLDPGSGWGCFAQAGALPQAVMSEGSRMVFA